MRNNEIQIMCIDQAAEEVRKYGYGAYDWIPSYKGRRRCRELDSKLPHGLLRIEGQKPMNLEEVIQWLNHGVALYARHERWGSEGAPKFIMGKK